MTETPGPARFRGDRSYVLTWANFSRSAESLAAEVMVSGFVPTAVLGLARGGLPAATFLSHLLGVPLEVMAVTRTTSDDVYSDKRDPTVRSSSLGPSSAIERVLIVDDVAGTGETLRLVVDTVRAAGAVDVRTVVLARNHVCAFEPDHCAHVIDDWIVFPWERKAPAGRRLVVLGEESSA